MERLSKKSIFSYGLGDLASQLVWSFVGTYLTVYYMDVVGLAPLAVSTILMAAKIWDAVNDPMMGGIAERTHTKWGRFRPYILFGAPFLGLFSVLTFTAPFGNGTAGIVWAAFTYIGAGMLYTLVNIPYGAMAGVMTTQDSDRNKLNSIRGIGMQVGMMTINFASSIILVKISGSTETISGKSYTIAAILFALISLPMFFIVFKNSKEVIMPKTSVEKVSIVKNLGLIFSNKYLMIIVLTMLFQMTGNMGRIGIMAFYVRDCLGNFTLMALLMTLPSIGSIIGNAFGGSIGVMLMAAFGYVAGADVTASAQHGINMAANLVPGIFFIIAGLLPLIFWKMTDKEADEIREKITARNMAE